jgi:hypothetical protein
MQELGYDADDETQNDGPDDTHDQYPSQRNESHPARGYSLHVNACCATKVGGAAKK